MKNKVFRFLLGTGDFVFGYYGSLLVALGLMVARYYCAYLGMDPRAKSIFAIISLYFIYMPIRQRKLRQREILKENQKEYFKSPFDK